MPNGGEHHEDVKVCPRCKSWRIHKRKGFHLLAKWRCRKCHATFLTPRTEGWIFPPGSEPWRGLVLADGTTGVGKPPHGRRRKHRTRH